MKLLIYKTKLALHLVLFILKLSANFSNKTKPLILGTFVIGLFVLISSISLFTSVQNPKETIAISTIIPKNTQLYTSTKLTEEQLLLELQIWEKVYEKQPLSRDVLLNLSHLYSALGQDEKAVEYKNKASFIDPNNPLFE